MIALFLPKYMVMTVRDAWHSLFEVANTVLLICQAVFAIPPDGALHTQLSQLQLHNLLQPYGA